MNKNDLIEILPRIHNMNPKGPKKEQKGYSKYEILKVCLLDPSKGNYNKVNECIDMGFLKQVNVNPPEFVPDRDKIWNFWKETPIGMEFRKMMESHAVVFG